MRYATVRKIYRGMVELRDYQVAEAMKKHDDITVKLIAGGKDAGIMVIPFHELDRGIETRTEESIFNGKKYKLIAFRAKFPKEVEVDENQGVLFAGEGDIND